jgi:hypothetical protein
MRHADDHCGHLLGAYVLGASPEPEADGVAEHLAQCSTCAADAERLREGADVLLEGVALTPPATTVKGRVMAQVHAEAALFEAARQGGYQLRGTAARPTRSRWSLPRVRLWALGPAVAVASVVILAVLGAGLLSSGLGSGAPERNVVAAQIKGGQAGGAAGSLEIRGDRAELRVRGLRSPGRGRVYQVWVRKDGQVPEPAGAVLALDWGGVARTRLSRDIRRFDQVLVTSEPAGGSRLPTRAPVLDVDTTA